jgi:hypothetical protein
LIVDGKADLYFSKIDKDMQPVITNKRVYSDLTSLSNYFVTTDSENNFHISIRDGFNRSYLKLDSNGDLIINSSLSEVQVIPDIPLVRANGNELVYLGGDGVVNSDNTLSIFDLKGNRYNSTNDEREAQMYLSKYDSSGSKIIDEKRLFSIPLVKYEYSSEHTYMYPIENLNDNEAWTLLTRYYSSESYAVFEVNYDLDQNSGEYNLIFSEDPWRWAHEYKLFFDTDKNGNKHIFIIDEGTVWNPMENFTILYKCSSFSEDYYFEWDQRNRTMIDFKVDSKQNINLLYSSDDELYFQKLRIYENLPAPIILDEGRAKAVEDYKVQLTPEGDETSYQTMCGTVIYPIFLVPLVVFVSRKNK